MTMRPPLKRRGISTPEPSRPQPVQAPALIDPLVLQRRAVTAHTYRPVIVQRQAVSPVLRAAELHAAEVARMEDQRHTLQRQVDSAALPAGAIPAALQRHAERLAPLTAPARPSTPGDWVTVMRMQARQVEGRRLTTRQAQEFAILQRQVATRVTQAYRSDPTPGRTETCAGHLVALQRHPQSAPVSRAVLSSVSSGERMMLQRAVDEALQRERRLQAQDAQALQVQSLQRQLADLDAEAAQPIFERIQARRGAGNPLPEAVQRHLEDGLNHDLSRVRIHDDAEADKLAKGVNAIAFTTGSDIFFRSGTFDPNSRSGLELLAHEVTHTVQQSQGRVGRGIDPDAGLEGEARAMGARLAVQPLARSKAHHRPVRRRAAFTPTTSFQRKAAPSPLKPPAQLTVGQIGVIKHTDGANLRAQPTPQGRKVLPNPLPVGTKVGVISQTADGWSKVSLTSGKTGFVQTARVTTVLPDPGSTLIKVPPGSTAIGIAERYYKGVVRPGQDLRFYVNVLEFVNRQRGTGAFQGGQALKGGNLLWIPSPMYAQTLAGTVRDGSVTGGALANANAMMGNSPGANIMRSVLEAPTHIDEVLKDVWKVIEKHWPVMLATTLAFVGAELLVGVLAAAPEPTTITKFAAVGLQGLITAVAGVGAIAAVDGAGKAAETWLRTAWTAGGNASRIKAASKAFLSMIGNIAMAVASAAGAQTSGARTGQLAGMYTRDQLIAQIGSKTTYEALMSSLKARGVTKNNAQVLGNLLKKVPDPLELKLFVSKTGNPEKLLGYLNKYPVASVRKALNEIDARSIGPKYADELLRIKLSYEVPTRKMTAKELAALKAKSPNGFQDMNYQGRVTVERKKLSPAQQAQDRQAGVAYQALLNDMIQESEYVYRYTSRYSIDSALKDGTGIERAYMTNVMTNDSYQAALGAQIKPEWYRFTDGVPEVVVKIPRRLLNSWSVPRPSGDGATLAGWEFTTSAYPGAGRGGLLQFMGTVDGKALSRGIKSGEIEVIPLTKTVNGRYNPPKGK
ncbi:eCIS core domain-containing protein [Deinococcus hohokamensis]|uniref:DUF4157 domain-containing protein n=1 Tax=Deinococcus hohokamensis TaxID=309883 RepID=A0ABV9I8Y8_9DEIO